MRHLLPSSATLFDCCTRRLPQSRAQWLPRYRIRYLHISTTTVNADRTIVAEPANTANATTPGLITRSSGSGHGVPTNEVIDARFEVSDSPLPLLNVSLSASQKLYTRRGTLVGVGGKAENVVSTLSVLEPFRRLVGRIPFLYQRISSTSPVTALISPKSTITSLAVVHLDGSTDWMVIGQSLLAWTGQTLSVKPTINSKMVVLDSEESYIAHPSNVVAYSMNRNPPQPYRLKSSSFRLQIPNFSLSTLLPDTKFFRAMSDSSTWRTLFLEFHGPVTILLQTRAVRLKDVLTNRDVNEIAEAPAGSVRKSLSVKADAASEALEQHEGTSPAMKTRPTQMSTASIGPDGKVVFNKEGAAS
ncbi:MAG: hypothetical protein LQ348_005248 [Seirophora lacunosa]|nr:MAG: hypothetical protein LQ348_005248 [Seirophora lacunosa]